VLPDTSGVRRNPGKPCILLRGLEVSSIRCLGNPAVDRHLLRIVRVRLVLTRCPVTGHLRFVLTVYRLFTSVTFQTSGVQRVSWLNHAWVHLTRSLLFQYVSLPSPLVRGVILLVRKGFLLTHLYQTRNSGVDNRRIDQKWESRILDSAPPFKVTMYPEEQIIIVTPPFVQQPLPLPLSSPPIAVLILVRYGIKNPPILDPLLQEIAEHTVTRDKGT